jgi:predicted Zn-dependent protease
MERGAVEIAESQFRRAAWLHPYEASFRVHWAIALRKLQRKSEAHELLREVLTKNPDHKEALQYWRENWPDEQSPCQNAQRQQDSVQPNTEAGP